MVKILGLFPLKGNGGIVSWANSVISSFSDGEFLLITVDTAPDQDFIKNKGFIKIFYSAKALVKIFYNTRKAIKDNPDIRIMHITTSGDMGTLRDHLMVRLCQKKNIKCIMHCHFGSVKYFYTNKGIWSWLFRKNIEIFDQTWVLDKHSASFLRSILPTTIDKIKLTPNSIEVPSMIEIKPCDFKKVGFVGNITVTKGIFELIKAFKELDGDTHLYIAGVGSEADVNHMIELVGSKMDQNIHFLGKLSNQEAVKLIESLDILCLPTYFEAFPISILEAMSRGKMIITCPKGAIPDMLALPDGSLCGLLVPDKTVHELADAIKWCQNHLSEAFEIRKKAYEKVKTCYRKEVVYDIYRQNYRKLLYG